MSGEASRLSLGALPRSEAVKLTVTLSAELKAQLDDYAEVHGRAHQVPVGAMTLIPHMPGAFIARDRGFKTLSANKGVGERKINAVVEERVCDPVSRIVEGGKEGLTQGLEHPLSNTTIAPA